MSPLIACLLVLGLCAVGESGTDFYDVLGVPRSASSKEIRVAFKKLVVRMHPDKNKDDPSAHERFLGITRAYEVLKDEDLRRRYDIHGEEGIRSDRNGSPSYHSWQFYREQFGIYDDDREIITLSRSDFSNSVENSDDQWFINFYSPHCSHCHDLAPDWREVARELEGVIRIGAVNCGDEGHLCSQQGITAYPSLIIYPQRERFRGKRSRESLVQFVLDRSPISAFTLTLGNFADLKLHHRKAWLVTVCGLEADCCFPLTMKKLALMLGSLVSVGTIDCLESALCSRLDRLGKGGTFFLANGLRDLEKGSDSQAPIFLKSLEAQRLGRAVLRRLLPRIRELTADEVKEIMSHLDPKHPMYLLRFYVEKAQEDLELRKLPATLAQLSVQAGQIDCNVYRKFCNSLYLTSFPKFALVKGNSWELYYGRPTSNDLGNFVRSSIDNPMLSFGPKDFPNVIDNGDRPLFVEFFSPFCPYCLEQMVAVKALAARLAGRTQVGTVDCSMHRQLCQEYDVQEYPTTIFYNNSKPHTYHGAASVNSMESFIDNILNSRVVRLTPHNFDELVGKPKEMWAIDFFAPWCAPCQKLEPTWRRLAKTLEKKEKVRIGNVDCTVNREFCRSLGVRSYPTIRFYKSATKYVEYPYNYRDHTSLYRWILDNLPSVVRRITPRFFASNIAPTTQTWVVDFYVPWCGHCFQLAPEFEELARRYPQLRFGKVNCEEFGELCKEQDISYYPAVLVLPWRRFLDTMRVDALQKELNAVLEKEDPSALRPHTEL